MIDVKPEGEETPGFWRREAGLDRSDVSGARGEGRPQQPTDIWTGHRLLINDNRARKKPSGVFQVRA